MKVYQKEEFNLPGQRLDQPQPVKIEESLERLSWLMDDLIRVPGLGWRFGLDAIVGLIPGLGDTATSLVSFYILVAAVLVLVAHLLIRKDRNWSQELPDCSMLIRFAAYSALAVLLALFSASNSAPFIYFQF